MRYHAGSKFWIDSEIQYDKQPLTSIFNNYMTDMRKLAEYLYNHNISFVGKWEKLMQFIQHVLGNSMTQCKTKLRYNITILNFIIILYCKLLEQSTIN